MLRRSTCLAVVLLLNLAAAPPATQPDLSTPQGAVSAYYRALFDGDWASVEAATVNDESSTAWLKALHESVRINRAFFAAVRDKFSEDAAKRLIADTRPIIMRALSNTTATINGDKAIVELPLSATSKQRLNAAKVGDVWKYDARVTDIARQEELTQSTAARSKKIAALTPRVEAGEFKTAEELEAVFRQETRPGR